MALGRPKRTDIAAIRKRWAPTVKGDLALRRSWYAPRSTPTAWHQVLSGEPLPSAEQAALDIIALLDRVEIAEQAAAEHADQMKTFWEMVELAAPHADDGRHYL